jgi:hypothetical protein
VLPSTHPTSATNLQQLKLSFPSQLQNTVHNFSLPPDMNKPGIWITAKSQKHHQHHIQIKRKKEKKRKEKEASSVKHLTLGTGSIQVPKTF